MDWLLQILMKLLGIHAPEGSTLVRASLDLRGSVDPAWFILGTLVLGAIVGWMYMRTTANLRIWKWLPLALLRTLFLALLLLILLRPVISLTTEGNVRRALVILADGTLSMETADHRGDIQDELKRVAIAKGSIDPEKGLNQPLAGGQTADLTQISRLDLLKTVLKNSRLKLLERLAKEYDLHIFQMGVDAKTRDVLADLTPPELAPAPQENKPSGDNANASSPPLPSFAWVDKLSAASPVTPLGDAVRAARNRMRGQPLAGIIMMTDGGNNSGSDPMIAAQTIAREEDKGLPLYAYGIGMSSPKDIIVSTLFGPEVSFVKDEVSVNVRVRSQNLNNQSAKLQLFLGKDLVDSRPIQFGLDGEQVVSMKFTPAKAGEYDMRAFIEPRDDEASKTNNEASQHLRVVDGKIKVLLVEQQPRWEFKYLQAQLMRDRRVDFKCVLFEADPGASHGKDSPYLERFPQTKDELFKYDLIVLGDVDPALLTPPHMEHLSEFVSKFGGGLLMIAGKRFSPHRYGGTEIEKMLPVVLETGAIASASAGADVVADRPIKLELTEKGKRDRMLQLSDKPQENLARWAQLPPIYWEARVARAKQAAEVLLVDPDPAKAARGGSMPVIAAQQYGLGNVVFFGTDNTWRWRRNQGDVFYLTIWGQVIQRLALPHLLGASKRTQLRCDREKYTVGERVTIYARLYNQNYDAITDGIVKASVSLVGADETAHPHREVLLRAEPDAPGQYRAEFVTAEPGNYQFHVEKPGDPTSLLAFSVTKPTTEQGETAMNEALLRDMTTATGGEFFREEDLYKLPDSIRLHAAKVASTQEVEIWSTPLYFLVLLGMVTIEWVLRKMSQLK